MSKVPLSIKSKSKVYKSIKRIVIRLYKQRNDDSIIFMHRIFAVVEFIEKKDPQIFKHHIRRAGKYRIERFKRLNAGEFTPSSRIGVFGFSDIYDYLAMGDLKLSKQRMDQIKPEHFDELSLEYLYPFNIILKHLVMGTKKGEEVEKLIKEFEEVAKKSNEPYKSAFTKSLGVYLYSDQILGFLRCFRGINQANEKEFMEGIKKVVSGYKFFSGFVTEPVELEDEIFGFM